jgi:hypothetical protein
MYINGELVKKVADLTFGLHGPIHEDGAALDDCSME